MKDHCATGTANPCICGENAFFFLLSIFLSYIKILVFIFKKGYT